MKINKVEENCKMIAEYLKNLKVISYNEIVSKLKESETNHYIFFYQDYDAYNDKYYNCVIADNVRYLSQDQDDDIIYNNLAGLIREKIDLPDFQIVRSNCTDELVCFNNSNVVVFPQSIVEKLIENSSSYSKDNDMICIFNKRVVYLPIKIKEGKVKKYNSIK